VKVTGHGDAHGLVAGRPNKQIARDFDISPRAIEVYRANVMTKMQAGSLLGLVRLASEAGFSRLELDQDQHRFWPPPLITINPRYEEGASIDRLVSDEILDSELRRIFAMGEHRAPIRLHPHQERAIPKAQRGESFIVTTGTGSGLHSDYRRSRESSSCRRRSEDQSDRDLSHERVS
jgi:hypothetical protein